MISRLGVLGGMFDPVHQGHILAAQYALDTLALDKVKLIPCHHPNHRDPATAGPEHRLAMLRLAVAERPGLEIDSIELERQGTSYSVDTLLALRADPDIRSIVFVMGMDAFNSLPRWHRWRELVTLCHLLVLARPDSPISESVLELLTTQQRRVESCAELFADPRGNFLIARDFDHDISSTRVRSLIEQGQAASAPIVPDVLSYIEKHGLYRSRQ